MENPNLIQIVGYKDKERRSIVKVVIATFIALITYVLTTPFI